MGEDIQWLAGLLEGEGCFDLDHGIYPRIRLGMSDEDVVRRGNRLMGGRINGPYQVGGRKPYWVATVQGTDAARLMIQLHVVMGERRRAAIVHCLGEWFLEEVRKERRKHAKGS